MNVAIIVIIVKKIPLICSNEMEHAAASTNDAASKTMRVSRICHRESSARRDSASASLPAEVPRDAADSVSIRARPA